MILERIWPLLKLVIVAFVGLLLVDVLVFRSGLYMKWIEPNSSAGSVVASMMLIKRETREDARTIVVLGDSRIGEGFSGALADEAVAQPDLHFINGAIAGSTPRIWYYLLREVDPQCDRFSAVAMMVDYDPSTKQNDMGNYPTDTNFLQPLLRLTDYSEYADSYTDPGEKARARRSIVLPMQALRHDISAALRAPFKRFRDAGKRRRLWLKSVVDYSGRDQRLPELDIDAEAGAPPNWDGVADAVQPMLKAYFGSLQLHASEQTVAANNAYVDRWIGKIAQCYRASGGTVFVFSVPRGPWHERLVAAPELGGAVAELAKRGLVDPLPAASFVSLERPAFFFDQLHMNRDGRERFSRELATQIATRMH